MAGFIPDRGDVVWLSFDPQVGHEQAGRRPALTLSPLMYNERSHLGIFCPITTRTKGYPFEVIIPAGSLVSGAVLADHVKSMDWTARRAEFICKLPDSVVGDVLDKVMVLFGYEE